MADDKIELLENELTPGHRSVSSTFIVPEDEDPNEGDDEHEDEEPWEPGERSPGDPMDEMDQMNSRYSPPHDLAAPRHFSVPGPVASDPDEPPPTAIERVRRLVEKRLRPPCVPSSSSETSDPEGRPPSLGQRIQNFLRPTIVVLTGFLLSLTIASKIRFYPVLQINLINSPVGKLSAERSNLRWIGELYATISLVFVPLATGVIQLGELNYRFTVFVGGFLQLLGCLTSSGVYNPEYLLITDAFINGVSSAIILSVIILVMDDVFEEGNPYRILATSLCQGSVVGAFFICDLFSIVLVNFDWRYTYMMIGGLVFFECLLAAWFFPTIGIVCCTAFDPQNPDQVVLPSREADRKIHWRYRLLGVTTKDIAKCPSLLAWLFERMLVEIITNGVFLLLLQTTGMATDPSIPITHGKKRMEMLSAFFYSGGQSATYVIGASVGRFIRGFLIHTYTASAVGLMLSLLIWQTIRVYLSSIDALVANVLFAFLSGAFLGLLQTFAYTASEEATRIPARKAYPITKMMCGLANVIGPLLFYALRHVSSTVNVWLGCFSVMAGFDAIILVFILHKLHITRPRIYKTVR